MDTVKLNDAGQVVLPKGSLPPGFVDWLNRTLLTFDATTGSPSFRNFSGGGILARSGAAVSGAADTNENILATITIPAGLLGANGMIRVKTMWSFTNSANTKAMRVRFGGISGTAFMAATGFTTQVGLQSETIIMNRGATNSQVGGTPTITTDAGTLFVTTKATATADTTAATTVVITGQKATGAETLTLEAWVCEVFP